MFDIINNERARNRLILIILITAIIIYFFSILFNSNSETKQHFNSTLKNSSQIQDKIISNNGNIINKDLNYLPPDITIVNQSISPKTIALKINTQKILNIKNSDRVEHIIKIPLFESEVERKIKNNNTISISLISHNKGFIHIELDGHIVGTIKFTN